MGWKALISNSSAAVADCTQPTSSGPISMRPRELLPERLRRPDGDDACVRHPSFAPSSELQRHGRGLRLRAVLVRRQQAEPHQAVLLREHEVLRFVRQEIERDADRLLLCWPVSVSTCGFWIRRTLTVGTSVTVKSGRSTFVPASGPCGCRVVHSCLMFPVIACTFWYVANTDTLSPGWMLPVPP